MTDKLPANADWHGHTDDLIAHVLSDYAPRRVGDDVSYQLELQLTDWLEGRIEALVKSGRIALVPVRERVCQCWPCTVPLPDGTPAAPSSASAP